MKRRTFLASTAATAGILSVAGCGGGSEAHDVSETPAGPILPPTSPPAASTVPSWVANLSLWQWHQIPGTQLSSVDPIPKPLGVGGSRMKIDAWCGAALKRKGSVYIIGAAGGHADYGGNEIDTLALNTEAPAWVQVAAPSANKDMIGGSPFYLDLRGAATHTYYTSQYIESRGLLVVFYGAGVAGGPFPAPPAGWRYVGGDWHKAFNFNTAQWAAPDYIARIPSTGGATVAAMCCTHPVTGDVYYSVQGGVTAGWYVWSNADNAWTKTSSASLNYCGSAVDPVRNHILVVGGWNTVLPSLRSLTGEAIPVAFGGLGAGAITDPNNTYPGVIYDDANSQFVVMRQTADATSMQVHTVNAETFEVARPAMTGTAPPRRMNGTQNAIQYVPELKGFVIAVKHDQDVWFVRTSH